MHQNNETCLSKTKQGTMIYENIAKANKEWRNAMQYLISCMAVNTEQFTEK